MTFREKVTQEYPDDIAPDLHGGVAGCPYTYGYELHAWCECVGKESSAETCTECWNREMPAEDAKEIYKKALGDMGNTAQESAGYLKKVTGAIKDSGERREFASGAVRDIQEGKGRCDLMPLRVVANILGDGEYPDPHLTWIAEFQETGETKWLTACLMRFGVLTKAFKTLPTMFLEVAKHFEEGAKKYGENNWQKGLPVNCYIDSAVRHYLKWLRGDKDEPHDRAFVWNLMCCIWEVDFHEYGEEASDEGEIINIVGLEGKLCETIRDIRGGEGKVDVELKSDAYTVLYRCDNKACGNCSHPTCQYTSDIEHAVNFTKASTMVFVEKSEVTEAVESDKDDIQSEENDQWVRFGDCPIGLFDFNGSLYMKTICGHAFSVNSGAMQYFDPDTLVWRIDIPAEGVES